MRLQVCRNDAKWCVPTVIVQLESVQLVHKHAHKDISYIHRNLEERLAEASQHMEISLELENLNQLFWFVDVTISHQKEETKGT